MTWPDYAILATILISILVGFLRGFIKEVFSLVIWAAAFIVAYQYGGDLAVMMEDHVTLPSARTAMGFLGLFLVVLIIGGLLNYLIGRLVETTGLSGTDRLLGGVFGSARGLALVIVALMVSGFTPIPADPWWKGSAMIHRMMPMVMWAVDFLPDNVREHLDFNPEPEQPEDENSSHESDPEQDNDSDIDAELTELEKVPT
jgi:membrane protein required for colicin V production